LIVACKNLIILTETTHTNKRRRKEIFQKGPNKFDCWVKKFDYINRKNTH
jgi:hypothetical protein